MKGPSEKWEGGKSPAHERLRRLLLLVPLVSQRQGIGVTELAISLGMTKEALLEDLDLLTLVGRPPFQPDDYIDVYVENDRVYVDLDQRLKAPPRLTAAEAAALAASAALLRPAASEALARALSKLERVIPTAARARFDEMHRKLDLTLEASTEMAPLTRAIGELREVEFEYVSIGRGENEHRVVQPRELFSHRGQWYLSAFCCTRKDDRLFRLDRMRQVEVTSRTFVPSGGKRPQLGKLGERGTEEVLVRFSPKVALYQRERFGEKARALPDGGLEVPVSTDSRRWLLQWVLSFGGEAQVVSPPWAVEAVAQAAAEVLRVRPG